MSMAKYRRAARQYFGGPFCCNRMELWFEESRLDACVEPGYTSRTLFLYPFLNDGGNAQKYLAQDGESPTVLVLDPHEARELAGFLLGYADAMDKFAREREARRRGAGGDDTGKEGAV